MSDTIQSDVPAEETKDSQVQGGEESVGHDPVSRREAAMRAVKEKRLEQREIDTKAAALINNPGLTEEDYETQRAAELDQEEENPGDEEHDSSGSEDGGQQENGDPSAGAEDQEADELAPFGFKRNAEGQLVKEMKVAGRVIELTPEAYERHMSKDLAGDEKLRNVAEREAALEAERERLMENARKEEQPPAEDADSDLTEAVQTAVQAIYDGDQDAATETLVRVVQGRQQATPDLDQITEQVTTRVTTAIDTANRNKDAQEAWADFEEKYADIAQNDVLLAAANEILKQEYKENPDIAFADAIMNAGAKTKKLFASASPEKPDDEPPAPTSADRQQAKGKLTRVPSGNKRDKAEEMPQVDYSPQAAIDRMRAARAR